MRLLNNLQRLEAESNHIMREIAASFERPCMLYSIGKDSTVMLHLARKAFAPGKVPFTLLHIDTTWEFGEMANFRDSLIQKYGLQLIVHVNETALTEGIHPIESGSVIYNDRMKTEAFKEALDKYRFDSAIGGARRDEEHSRAKERIFSVRTETHRWDPKSQRPKLWNLYNTKLKAKETMRIFPLSNWTELDVWMYILKENIDIVPLYLVKSRSSWIDEVSGQILGLDDQRVVPYLTKTEKASIQQRWIRFSTLGCYPQTGAIESRAQTVDEIIIEMMSSNTSERQGRLLDKDQSNSMERKKQEGYF
jgi:sulfate adenylyltransferase subunit 2